MRRLLWIWVLLLSAWVFGLELSEWSGGQGQAKLPPTLEKVSVKGGEGVLATATADGKYQGMIYKPSESIDMSQVEAIEFDFYQDSWGNRGGDGNLIITYKEGSRNGLYCNFKFGKEKWGHVVVPIDLRTLAPLNRQSTAGYGHVLDLRFSIYNIFGKKGEKFGIANLKFVPKRAGSGALKVSSYRYVNKPDAGDEAGTALTDGVASKAGQAYWRQYSAEPVIDFDLGALKVIEQAEVRSVAAPGQNWSEITLSVSTDGKNFHPAMHCKNGDASASEKEYSAVLKGKAAGRWVRLMFGRTRSDFPVRVAEVSFAGRAATDADVAAFAESHYVVGPAMPPVSEKDYARFASGGVELWVSRANGVMCQLRQNGETLVERMSNLYELRGRGDKMLAQADGYGDKVASIRAGGDSLEVVTTNAQLPGLRVTTAYRVVQGALFRKVSFARAAGAEAILFSACRVAIPQEMRKEGLYETWGSGHDMIHKFASEVTFDLPADTGPVVQFESPAKGRTFLHTRYFYNGKYAQIGSGIVTVSGFGDKRTCFTASGWILGDGLFKLGTGPTECSLESALLFTKGGVMQSYDEYLALPEAKAFRASIRRPKWLGQYRFQTGQGWDNLFGDHGLEVAKYHGKLIREGYFVFGKTDIDFVWGDFGTSGIVRNEFGGASPAEQLREENREIHRLVPNAKVYEYTWLWSASKTSRIYREHPEWFITKTAGGQDASFFPGWGVNYYRRMGIPASRQQAIDAVVRFVDFYECDLWYLDGGGSPANIDWQHMEIDEPTMYDELHQEVRRRIQEKDPERAVHFNNPQQPLGDMGFLESFGGAMTSNWRDGATWMHKYKLWQRPDPSFMPLYIYWLPQVDAAFQQYAVGTGLNLTAMPHDPRTMVALMGAQYQSRWARMVEAGVQPNWRFDPAETWELMALKLGAETGWLYVKNHGKAAAKRKVSADLAPLGIARKDAPVHVWELTLRPYSTHKGVRTEGEQERDYRENRWASDFIVEHRYLGARPWSKRLEQEVELAPEQMKLVLCTQSPAAVYSVDGMRMQLLLPETLGVKVAGTGAALQVSSARKEAEIAVVVPAGRRLAGVAVNGKAVAARMVFAAGTRLAVAAVPQGESAVELRYEALAGAPKAGRLAVQAGRPGGDLKLSFAPAQAGVTVQVEQQGDAVWSAAGCEATAKIPSDVTGGDYVARAYGEDGTVLAEAKFRLAQGTPALPRFQRLKHANVQMRSAAFDSATESAPGVQVFGTHTAASEGCGEAKTDPMTALAQVSTLPNYLTHWNMFAAGLELACRRYVRVRLQGNVAWFRNNGPRQGMRGIGVKYDNPSSAMGLMLDFAGADGKWSQRTFASIGNVRVNRANIDPRWGAACVPQKMAVISNFADSGIAEEEMWLDLQALGAPTGWNGKLLLTLLWQNATPDRWMALTVLESRDSLPAGAKAVEPFFVKGAVAKAEVRRIVVPRTTEAPKVDGALGEAAWRKAPVLDGFTLLGNPVVKPPKTQVRLLHDGKMLYLAAEFEEPKEGGFTVNPQKQPWYNDGLECYFNGAGQGEAYVQYILTGSVKQYAQWNAGPGPGKAFRTLAQPAVRTVIQGTTMVIEAALPLADLGKAPIRFNFGRNRAMDGGFQHFTFLRSNDYRNFTGVEMVLE